MDRRRTARTATPMARGAAETAASPEFPTSGGGDQPALRKRMEEEKAAATAAMTKWEAARQIYEAAVEADADESLQEEGDASPGHASPEEEAPEVVLVSGDQEMTRRRARFSQGSEPEKATTNQESGTEGGVKKLEQYFPDLSDEPVALEEDAAGGLEQYFPDLGNEPVSPGARATPDPASGSEDVVVEHVRYVSTYSLTMARRVVVPATDGQEESGP